MTTALKTGIRRVATRLAPDPAPDGELLSRFLNSRDEAAFAALVRRHAPMVFGTCRRVLGNAADADDAFQAAFVVLVRKAHALTDRACVGNFLYGVAFHTALKAKAMATKRRVREARKELSQPTSTDSELNAILDEELARLPDKYREPVVLCELEGVSRKDAATRLGVPEGTISSRLATAHRMLEKRLKAKGFAAVAIAAMLGNQVFAVSDTLADAAVRAATSGAPAGVTHLVAEVTKMFLLHKLKVGVAVLAGVVLLLAAGVGVVQRGTAADEKAGLRAPVPKKEEKKDEDRIQGLWQAERVESAGEDNGRQLAEKAAFRFEGNKVTSFGRVHEFKLDATTLPKALDITLGDSQDRGKEKGTIEYAAYELDGDTLKICINKAGKPGLRPSEFKTVEADGFVLFVLKRVKEKKDEDRIQGLWEAESLEAEGQKASDAAMKQFQMRFKGNSVTFLPDDRTHTFELDSSAKPKALNLIPGDGAAKGKKLECAIYDLDGDTLKICMDKEGQAGKRPTEFQTAPKDGLALIVLKRMKEKPANPDRKGGGGDKKPDDAKAILGKWVEQSSAEYPPPKFAPTDKVFKAKNSWTFTDKGTLTNVSTVPGETHTGERRFELNPLADPKELHLTTGGLKMTWSYELSGDTLKVALCGDGKVRPPSIDPKDIPQGVAITIIEFTRQKDEPKNGEPKKEQAKKPDEPAWKAEFRKAYGLTDGQLVRRVAPPYPDCRAEYLLDLYRNRPATIPFDQWFAVLGWKGEWTDPQAGQFTMPIKPDEGVTLERLLDMTLKFPKTRVEGDATSLDRKVTGDFVVRAGADPEKAAAQLEAILRKECEVPVKFAFKDAEEEVFVLSGKYAAKPLDDRKAGQIEVYARHLTDRTTGGGGTGTLKEMADAVERHVGKPVVLGKVEGGPKRVSWHYSYRSPATRQEYADDRDAPTVLANIAEQTGLTVTPEKRKVRVLVVEHAEVKK